MSKPNRTTQWVCALSVIALAAANLSGCRDPAKKKLPVCPGDPRCEKLLY